MPLRTVNRQCSSGLQAVSDVAAYIKAGFYDIGQNESRLYIKMPWHCYFFGLIFLIFNLGIGAGLESMTVDRVNRLPNINPKVW